jgi:hypothetical protein
MITRRRIAIGATIWVTCGVLGAGFVNANSRAEFPDLLQSPRWAAMTRNRSVIMGIFFGPFSLLGSAVITGGFYDGWTLRGEAAPCKDAPKIWCKP